MPLSPPFGEDRTFERIRYHYEIEKKLAHKLRCASRQERQYLYSSLYDELYARVSDHPQLIQKASENDKKRAVMNQIKLLSPFLSKNITFVEIGPGDCALALEVSEAVKAVIGIDVSDAITSMIRKPANFTLILSDGTSVPLPAKSVDIAYSHQLIEHLHPEDAFIQLTNIYNCLSIGGTYICCTPNKLSGPHDISKYFDVAASGFHLKEYTYHDLYQLFRHIGFKSITPICGARDIYITSNPLVLCIENACRLLRYIGLSSIVKSRLFGVLLPRGIIATK